MSKFLVKRVRSVLEARVIEANNAEEAIKASRKTLKKSWKILDDKRRKNYSADEVTTA